MELRQLRYFVGVVEAGSLLKASTRLHVAQPALGQQIAALEAELGGRLFDRSSRGMSLTDAGRAFLDHARVVLADVERARGAVRESVATPAGDVAIGLPTTVALSATVPIVQACRERLPQVRLRVVEAYSGFLREWLHLGRLDLAILYGGQQDPALVKRPLLDERLAWVTRRAPLGAGHAKSSAREAARRGGPQARDGSPPARLPLSRLVGQELVLPSREHGLRRIIDDACAPAGLVLDVVAEIDSLPSVKRAVQVGIGSTILPLAAVAEEVAEGRLHASTITDAAMRRRIVMATSVTRPITAASAAVMALAVESIERKVIAGHWPGTWIGGRSV